MVDRYRRRPRADLIVLSVVLVCVAALVAGLLIRLAQDRDSASAIAYPQIVQTSQPPGVPTVAFIGDSYSAGTGSTGYNTRFTTLIAAYEGWSSESFAFGGTGYLRSATTNAKTGCGANVCPSFQEVLPRVVSYDPTIVFISGGRNDVGLPQADVESAVAEFYAELRHDLPKTKIIVTSPVWAYTTPPAQLSQIKGAVERSASRVGATYLDVGEPLVQDRSLVSSDHVHPNNRGHAALAQAMEAALSRADASPPP